MCFTNSIKEYEREQNIKKLLVKLKREPFTMLRKLYHHFGEPNDIIPLNCYLDKHTKLFFLKHKIVWDYVTAYTYKYHIQLKDIVYMAYYEDNTKIV